MNGAVSVTVRSSETPSYIGGPVPATITVVNNSNAPVSIQLAYPVPELFRVACRNSGVAVPRTNGAPSGVQSPPIQLAPGASYAATYFLNRYFTFHSPGDAVMDWNLTLPYRQGPSPTVTAEFQGSFRVRLTRASEQELSATLADYARNLHSPDRLTKQEAAEALAFLDTPLSAEYVLPMLTIENLEVIGVHALGRNPSRAYDDRIVAMLSHRDSVVVGAALEEIGQRRIPVNRDAIQRLLTSENPNIQWLALGWLSEHPNREDLRLLPPLLASPNEAVRERAQAYEKSLALK